MLPSIQKERWPRRVGVTVALGVAFTLVRAAIDPAAADVLLRCSTKKVAMTSGPRGEASTSRKLEMTFRINDAARTIALGKAPLAVSRFDRTRITAERDGVIYDIDRQSQTLSYAGSRASGPTVTTIVGSGTCAVEPSQK
ncbi:MAG: hypothetical protein P8Y53_05430 [Pseudolabrys sp.]